MEGRNCWRRPRADRLALLVDGEAYFRALKSALLAARHSVQIIGWEFDGRVRLDRPDSATPDSATPDSGTIGELLREIVRSRPGLKVNVLVWKPALFYSFDREFLPLVKHDWLTHRRLRYRLDDAHPMGASQHQKMVVIDDEVAFLGGLDISGRRWDSPAHMPRDPRRSDPGYPSYDAFHDVQCAVSGEAAQALGELARWRWRNATGQRLAPPPPAAHDPWPSWLPADVEDVTVALARTQPAWEGEPAVREVERLFVDMISAARHCLYVENQYFASRSAADILIRRLSGEAPPEVAVVTSGHSAGFLERAAMAGSRARLQPRLEAADRLGRLRFYAPMIQGRPLKVHSKVMIGDDQWLRIGSANLNNRSMGLDSECDLLLEAGGDPRLEKLITGFRHRLLAEHLGCQPSLVAEEERSLGMHGAIAALGRPERRLRPLEAGTVPPFLMPGTEMLDPDRPVEGGLMAAADSQTSFLFRPLAARFATGMGLLAVLVLLAALWRHLPHSPWPWLDSLLVSLEILRSHPLSPLLVAGVFLLTGLTGLPPFLLVVATASLFGGWLGALYSLAGALLSAGFSYSLGAALGRDLMRNVMGRRATRINGVMRRHGIFAMAMLRLVPVASFTAVNLMAGASHVNLSTFLAGSVFGFLPMVAGLSIFGDRFAAVLKHPDSLNTALLSLLTVAMAAAGSILLVRLRRAAPAIARSATK